LYFPSAHAKHGPPLGPVKPRSQTQLVPVVDPAGDFAPEGQAVHVIAPVVSEYVLTRQLRHNQDADAPMLVEYLPAPQSVHATEPVVVLYFPAAHAKHVPPSGPVNPRLQTQSVSASLPMTDCELEGQLRQVLAVVAPVVVEYLPAMQSEHSSKFKPVLYFPATHAMHDPVGTLVYPAGQASTCAKLMSTTASIVARARMARMSG